MDINFNGRCLPAAVAPHPGHIRHDVKKYHCSTLPICIVHDSHWQISRLYILACGHICVSVHDELCCMCKSRKLKYRTSYQCYICSARKKRKEGYENL